MRKVGLSVRRGVGASRCQAELPTPPIFMALPEHTLRNAIGTPMVRLLIRSSAAAYSSKSKYAGFGSNIPRMSRHTAFAHPGVCPVLGTDGNIIFHERFA